MSLASRVLAAVLALLLAGGICAAFWTLYNGRIAAEKSYDRILLGAANDIAESIRVQRGAPVVDLPVSAFQLLAQAPDDRIHYAVRGPGGRFITGLETPHRAPGRTAAGPVYFDSDLQGEDARFVRIARRFAERDFSGEVTVTVGQTLLARRAMALELVTGALVPMVLAGGVLMILAWAVIRSAMRPLDTLSEEFSARDPQDLTPVSTEGLPRELGVLLAGMNRFMGRIDRQVEGMRTLISDSAHQLRTPVAAIRVQAETLLEQEDGPARDRSLARILARTRSLGTLLDKLLSRALAFIAPKALRARCWTCGRWRWSLSRPAIMRSSRPMRSCGS